MIRSSMLALLLFAGGTLTAHAAGTATTNDAYLAAKKEAAARYEADKKLCADESTSSARMQCLRDARAEYDKALAAAKPKPAAESPPKPRASSCAECGKVLSVTTAEKEGKGGPLGMIAGGVAGALLGQQVGKGTGKDVATIAGAAGGAYAGHKIEEKMKTTKIWTVRVRMDSGEERGIDFDHDPGLAQGDLVKVSGNTITRR